jgi:hypothetical protein
MDSAARHGRTIGTSGPELRSPRPDGEAMGHLPPIKAGATHPLVPYHKTRALADINFKRLSSALPGESNAYLEDTSEFLAAEPILPDVSS